MKNARILVFAATITSLLTACGTSEKSQESTNQSTPKDSVTATAPKPKNCQSIIPARKLGKADEYQESGKSIKVALTLAQDTSALQTAGGCYFNHTVMVLTTKKSGSQVFKRTLSKDDLLYFVKSDDVVNRSLLQTVIYKPTFNGQRYITLTMQLLDPESKKKAEYLIFMNYFGEIVKVK